MLLVERAAAAGLLRIRRWESPDYTAPALELERRASELRRALMREEVANWRFTLPLERILAWLEGPRR